MATLLPRRIKGIPIKSRRGFEFETEVFGRSATWAVRGPYQSFSVSLREVLDHQPADWNPFQPPTKIAGSLYWHTVKHWRKGDRSKLGLYVAIGTALDFWHNVDALFYYGDPKTDWDWYAHWRLVTIDLSLDKPGSKAHLRLERSDVAKGKLLMIGGAIAACYFGFENRDALRSLT